MDGYHQNIPFYFTIFCEKNINEVKFADNIERDPLNFDGSDFNLRNSGSCHLDDLSHVISLIFPGSHQH